MNAGRITHPIAVILAVGILSGCAEQARSRMDIEARADDALRKMSAAIGGARAFSFRTIVTMDEPVASGQMAQFTRENRIILRRPDKVFAEARQDEDALFLWYEGTNLTVLDKGSNTYAALRVPDRIDAMLDEVAEKYGLTVPLADLLFSDPYKTLTADAHMGRYVGTDDVDGVKCHHLLFTQEAIDWQIWIDAGKDPLPRKFVIDYKSLPGRPEFSAVLSDWVLSAPAGEESFKPAVPNEAKKVELAQLFEAAAKGE